MTDETPCSIRQLWPLFAVSEIERSIAFYRDGLGFSLVGKAESEGKVFWCRLERGGASVMLQQACSEDGPPETWGKGVLFYHVCGDADAMYRELSARGLPVAPPTVACYGMKQLHLRDPDGYSLCFESPTEGWKE